jgi:hypothetical protein
MSRRFGPFNHVIRLASIFVAALAAFVLVRAWLVPSDFGVYGHYRAGALADNRARPIAFAGQASCAECHTDVVEQRQAGRHAQVRCEACHGPLARHASGEDESRAPARPDPRRTCLRCHVRMQGKPAAFPQIDVKEHAEAGACTECHAAHNPTGS